MGTDYKTGTVKITVNYGYDIHCLLLSKQTFDRIAAGTQVTKRGQGFPVEGEWEQDWWRFNGQAPWSVEVTTEEAREIYTGLLSDDEVWVDVKMPKAVVHSDGTRSRSYEWTPPQDVGSGADLRQ